LALKLNGSAGFRFAPVAERTEARIASNWPHPSFQGTTLPASHRIDKAGFEATWRIPALARGLPRLWSLGTERHHLAGFSTGVAIADPVHLYAKVERAVKYAILYVALTFLTFLVFEMLLGARLHLVQYGLVGLALSLFYLTLLSLAEHIAFGAAYLAAAAVIVVMIAGYAWAALRSRGQAAIAAIALSALYTVLYTILRMEDFALLAGTGLLILVTALLMLVTRNLSRANAPTAQATS
jgi:inner membrane protein